MFLRSLFLLASLSSFGVGGKAPSCAVDYDDLLLMQTTSGRDRGKAKTDVEAAQPVSPRLHGRRMSNWTDGVVASSKENIAPALVEEKLRSEEEAKSAGENQDNGRTLAQTPEKGGDSPTHLAIPGTLHWVNLFGRDIVIVPWLLWCVPFFATSLGFFCFVSPPLDDRNSKHVFRLFVRHFLVAVLSCVVVGGGMWVLWKTRCFGIDIAVGKRLFKALMLTTVFVLLTAVAVMHNWLVRYNIETRSAEMKKESEPGSSAAKERSNNSPTWCILPSAMLSAFKGRRGNQSASGATSSHSKAPEPLESCESEWKAVAANFRLDEVIDKVRRWEWIAPFLTKTGMSEVAELTNIPGVTCTVSGTKQTFLGPVTPKITYTLQESTAMIEIISRSVTAGRFVVEGRFRIVATNGASEVRTKTTITWLESPQWLKSRVERATIEEAETSLQVFVELICPHSTLPPASRPLAFPPPS
jgi:hypothetical protein